MSVFAVSIAPVAPFPVIGMVAGHAGVPLFEYLGGTAAGMLPGTLATTVFAGELAKVLDDPSQINYWIVGGVVLFFVVLTLGVRRWLLTVQQRRGARQPPLRSRRSGSRSRG